MLTCQHANNLYRKFCESLGFIVVLTCQHANNLYRKFCESLCFIVMMPTILTIHMESFCSIVMMPTMLTIYMKSFNVILIIFVLMMLTMHVECFISCWHIIWNALTVYKIKSGLQSRLIPRFVLLKESVGIKH